MKQLLLSFALSLTIVPLVHGQDCDWKEKKKDPVSDQVFIRSKKIVVVGDQKFGQEDKKFVDVHLELAEGKVFLYAYFQRYVLMSDEKVAAPKAQIRLADKSFMELTTDEVFSSKLSIGLTEINFRFQLSADQLKTLAQSPAVGMRISFSGQDFLFELKDKKADNLQKQFECMVTETSGK